MSDICGSIPLHDSPTRFPRRKPRQIQTVSIRDLSRNARGVVSEVASAGRPAIVTKHGAPVAAVIAIPPGDLEDFVLSRAASFFDDMNAANADLAAGRTRPAAEVFAELEG